MENLNEDGPRGHKPRLPNAETACLPVLSIISYGHSNGPLRPTPAESSTVEQLTFSVRDIENPPVGLRKSHTGLSARLRKEVFANDSAKARLAIIHEAVEAKMDELDKSVFQAELGEELPVPSSRSHKLVVGIMCEEGKHRSVAFAEELARKMKPPRGWVVLVEHRDLGVVAPEDEESGSDADKREPRLPRKSKKQRELDRRKGRSSAGKFIQGEDTLVNEDGEP
jgi:hypothetical protein